MLIEIVRRTPPWVWVLLVALLALGLSRLRARRVSRAWLLALPAALTLLGLAAVVTTFLPPGPALAAWAAGLAAGTTLGRRLPRPPGAAWDTDRRTLWLPGSALPLAVIVVVFTLRYVGSVSLALHPAWREALGVALPMAAAYGAGSGLLVGRVLGLRPGAAATMRSDGLDCHA